MPLQDNRSQHSTFHVNPQAILDAIHRATLGLGHSATYAPVAPVASVAPAPSSADEFLQQLKQIQEMQQAIQAMSSSMQPQYSPGYGAPGYPPSPYGAYGYPSPYGAPGYPPSPYGASYGYPSPYGAPGYPPSPYGAPSPSPYPAGAGAEQLQGGWQYNPTTGDYLDPQGNIYNAQGQMIGHYEG